MDIIEVNRFGSLILKLGLCFVFRMCGLIFRLVIIWGEDGGVIIFEVGWEIVVVFVLLSKIELRDLGFFVVDKEDGGCMILEFVDSCLFDGVGEWWKLGLRVLGGR